MMIMIREQAILKAKKQFDQASETERPLLLCPAPDGRTRPDQDQLSRCR